MLRRLTLLALMVMPLVVSGQEGCGVKLKGSDRSDMEKALTHYNAHQYREASQLLRKVAQKNPKAAEPQFWLGMVSVKNGFNVTGVRKYFPKCLELCPQYPNALAHYYMGMIHYTDERYDEAIGSLEHYFRLANASDDKAQTAVYDEASAYLHWSRFLSEANLNQAPFDPRLVAGVSSKRNETLPYITHDGRQCYYLRQTAAKQDRNSFYVKTGENLQWKLFVSQWEDTAFSKGTELPAPFNQGVPEGSVSLTADGRELYYSRITTVGGYANSDIYFTTREEGRWSPLQNAGTNVNGDRTWESQPSVSPDGSVLYFASNRKGGYGGTDIWRCRRLKNGDWSRPENLGSAINTLGNEKFPFIHADGHTLYFVSDGWQGFGGYDIYFADVNDAGSRQPTNLGLPINTDGDELSFAVTTDGTRAYFPGRLPSSTSSEVLMFDLYPAARPEAMACYRLAVTDADDNPIQAEVSLDRGTTYRGEGSIGMLLSMQEDNILTVSAEGKMPGIVSISAASMRRGKASGEVTLLPAMKGTEVPLQVSFVAGSRLTADSERVLKAWVAWLIENPRVHVAIECRKAAEAKAIYDYFLSQKLRAERLSHRGGTDINACRLKVQ